jgi:hypothetical protein
MSARPAPEFAAEEQHRADGMATLAANIANPAHPSHGSLPLYQQAARAAYETAAQYTEQPDDTP